MSKELYISLSMFYYNTVYILNGSCDSDMSLGKGCPDILFADTPDNLYEYIS